MTPTSIEASSIPFLKTLGISLDEIGERHALMSVTIDERHLNYLGGVHGGLLAALIDTVSFFPKPLLPSGITATTVGLSVNYVRAAGVGDTLVARSELLHFGRSTASLSIRIIDQTSRLVAHGSVTLLILQNSPNE